MCDLWRYTTTGDTPDGAIPRQIADALEALRAEEGGAPPFLKLYNAGSFFDPRAVPPGDDEAIAALLGSHRQVIVESHPALVGDRAWRFQDALHAHAVMRATPPSLQVAMGLETAHPQALEQLHKHVTVERFASAAAGLAAHGVSLRVFVLVHPPFIPVDDQDAWLVRSLDLAFACSASVVSLIPTRAGNGAMEALAEAGLFVGPGLSDLERSFALALRSKGRQTRGNRRVLVDLWDLDRFVDCLHCGAARRDRLKTMNLTQQAQPPVTCTSCAGSAS
jgi:radical SAM enzyme (TIGR01210 family)